MQPATSGRDTCIPEAVSVEATYRGVVIASKVIGSASERFTVGWGAGVDAPAAADVAWAPIHTLVRVEDGRIQLALTPAMTAALEGLGRSEWHDGRTAREVTFRQGEARLQLGALQVNVRPTTRGLPVGVRPWRWDPSWHGVLGGVVLALMVLLGLLMMVPPDRVAFAVDPFERGSRHADWLLIPQVPPPAVSPPSGVKGKEGSTGDRQPGPRPKQATGPVTKVLNQLRKGGSREDAVAAAASRGIVGILGQMRSSPGLEALFSRDTGDGGDDALTALMAPAIADAYHVGGTREPGTGAPGAGEGQRTIGMGIIGTGCGDRCGSSTVGWAVANRWTPRPKHALPEVHAGRPESQGRMDKEIIRRVIRRHLNEVRYCYEQELTRTPRLAGRLVSRFVIAGNGTVTASTLESSTLANPRVEACVTAAVRRWDFPQPQQGGVAIVSYPFVFAPAGSELSSDER